MDGVRSPGHPFPASFPRRMHTHISFRVCSGRLRGLRAMHRVPYTISLSGQFVMGGIHLMLHRDSEKAEVHRVSGNTVNDQENRCLRGASLGDLGTEAGIPDTSFTQYYPICLIPDFQSD